MTGQPEIREEITRYEVNAMPAGAMDADQFALKVERWPDGSWTVGFRSTYVSVAGELFTGSTGKFSEEEALRLARELAPQIRVGGMTAAEYQVWARERVVGRG